MAQQKIRVTTTNTIEVDVQTWADEYGIDISEVVEDAKVHLQNLADDFWQNWSRNYLIGTVVEKDAPAKPNPKVEKFIQTVPGAPVWRCGILEIRDVKKDGHSYARSGWDGAARYNLWVGEGRFPVEIADRLGDLKAWALENLDPATGEKRGA